jgi:THO complex subunit 4
MQYGPNGRSLGSATVIFHKPDHAAKAMQALDNIRIDNRLIRVEVILSARDAPVPTKQASLADRVTYALLNGRVQKKHMAHISPSQPKKDKPKPATATKEKTTEAATRGRGGRGGRARGRGGRAPRDKKKTVEELDAEMEDYFPAGEGGNDAMATNGAGAGAGQTAVGDTAMDDEML